MLKVFIVNPIAGRGKSLKIAKALENFCHEEQVASKFIYTSAPKQATEIVKSLGDGHMIYSIGGDGTLSEIVNGMVGTNNQLSILPAGSGNDFIKTVEEMPNKTFGIDIGLINERYFINIASIGIDAEVANNVKLMKEKKVPTSMLYNASILYSLWKRKDPTVSLDTFFKGQITLMAICNGKYYGNGFNIAPHAEIEDGFFDVCLADHIKTYQLLPLLLKLKRGKHGDSPFVHFSYADEMRIISEEELICNVDGEIIKGNRFDIALLPKAIILNNENDKIKEFVKKMKH